MQVEEVLAELGGTASRAELLAHVTEGALRRAVAGRSVARVARGRYALPPDPVTDARLELPDIARRGRRAAHEISGTAMLLSASARWGWQSKWLPTRPQVAVPRGRTVPPDVRRRLEVRLRTLGAGDREDGWVTSRRRTALDCASELPEDEAVAVLDSALREGAVDRDELLLGAAGLPPRYRRRAEELIRFADPRAANPFESVLRWIVFAVPGLAVQPQVTIADPEGTIGTVDLADEELKIVLEADSFEWHGDREALDRDATRYDRLVAEGWLVLRLTWHRVMNDPEWVLDIVRRVVALRDLRV